MTDYINLLQGKIIRYEQGVTSENIKGIFTDGITTCYMLIFSGFFEGRRRICAIHCDGHIFNHNPEILLREKEWVGNNSSCYIYRDPKSDQENDLLTGEKTHPFISYAVQNNIPLKQVRFDSSKGTIELAITFDNSETGYKVTSYFNGKFKENILSHPRSIEIYAFYIYNLLLNEVHSNAAFSMLYRQDPALYNAWNNFQITFSQRRQITFPHTQTSNPNYNALLFDGKEFLDPGQHDLQLTDFSQVFFNELDSFLSQGQKAMNKQLLDIKNHVNRAQLRFPASIEQLAIIFLITKQDSGIDLSHPNALSGTIDHSSAITEIYLLIKNDFDLEKVRDPETLMRLRRFTQQSIKQEERASQLPPTISISQSSLIANISVDEAVSQLNRITINYRSSKEIWKKLNDNSSIMLKTSKENTDIILNYLEEFKMGKTKVNGGNRITLSNLQFVTSWKDIAPIQSFEQKEEKSASLC